MHSLTPNQFFQLISIEPCGTRSDWGKKSNECKWIWWWRVNASGRARAKRSTPLIISFHFVTSIPFNNLLPLAFAPRHVSTHSLNSIHGGVSAIHFIDGIEFRSFIRFAAGSHQWIIEINSPSSFASLISELNSWFNDSINKINRIKLIELRKHSDSYNPLQTNWNESTQSTQKTIVFFRSFRFFQFNFNWSGRNGMIRKIL